MEEAGTAKTGGGSAALAVAVVALIVGFAAIGLSLMPKEAGTTTTAEKTRELTLTLGEGEIIQEVNENATTGDLIINEDGEDKRTGEFHRWEPAVLVINEGDTVKLTVKNPHGGDHSFAIVDAESGAFSGTIFTGDIQGRVNSGTATGTETTITFTANKAGIYKYACATPFDEDTNKCAPDHETQVGFITVL